MVQVALAAGDARFVLPWLGDQNHHSKRQRNAVHHEKFQRVVQHGRIRSVPADDRQHLVHVLPHTGGMHGFFAREHTVRIAADGIDLAVVQNIAVRMRALPARCGVGGKARVHRGDHALVILVPQISIEPPQLTDEEHPLVHHGTRGQRADIGIVVALFKDAADDIQLAVKFQPARELLRTADKALGNKRHGIQRLFAENAAVGGHIAPAEQHHTLLFADDFKHLLRLTARKRVLRKEKHTDAVVTRRRQ